MIRLDVECAVLTKLIADRNPTALVRAGLNDVTHFREHPEAYKFVYSHLEEYHEVPDISTVIEASVKGRWPKRFEPEESSESIETLCIKLHDLNDKRDLRSTVEAIASSYATSSGHDLVRLAADKIDEIKQRAYTRFGNGVTNWSTQTDERKSEYDKRAAGEFGSAIPLFWDEINEAVGYFHRGDDVVIVAWTKRGKSWVADHAALVANRAGFRVLEEKAESTKHETNSRLDTLEFGISNRGIWSGSLDELSYQRYVDALNELKRQNRPSLIVRTPEDWRNGLTVAQIEADIDQFSPDVVIVDQFNLMRHHGSTWNDKAETSRQLKLLAARKGVVLVLVTQANGEYGKRTNDVDDDARELRPPSESDYSETIAVIQDATHVIAFDSVQHNDPTTGKAYGKAQAIVRISRTGGAGATVDLEWMPNDGVIRPRTGTDDF